jgi:hypothetical protein
MISLVIQAGGESRGMGALAWDPFLDGHISRDLERLSLWQMRYNHANTKEGFEDARFA